MEKECLFNGQQLQQFRRDDVVDNNHICRCHQVIRGGKLCDGIKRCGKLFLIFSAVFGVKIMNGKAVIPQQLRTFLHVPFDAADNAVVFAQVNDFFHNSPR